MIEFPGDYEWSTLRVLAILDPVFHPCCQHQTQDSELLEKVGYTAAAATCSLPLPARGQRIQRGDRELGKGKGLPSQPSQCCPWLIGPGQSSSWAALPIRSAVHF